MPKSAIKMENPADDPRDFQAGEAGFEDEAFGADDFMRMSVAYTIYSVPKSLPQSDCRIYSKPQQPVGDLPRVVLVAGIVHRA